MPANPFSDGLSVRVSGDTSDARSALGGLQNSILSTRKLAVGLGGVLAGALAVRGLGAATQAAADFETAMVEVQKVTDPETAAELAGRMRELSSEIPVAQEELAALAADAARFGIRGTENIENFTETVSKMAIATDLTEQEAGEAFARLATLTETPVEEIENLGSSINTLSNNFATSSSEIVDSMLRSSAALTQFGLSNTQITAMSAALNEVSESSQRAGSRLRRLGQELLDPRRVGDLSDALGMTEEEFRNIRREDPAGLMMQIVRAFAEGGETAEALRGSLTTTSRQAVAGLAQNLDGLDQALNQSSNSFREATSLQREFDAATQTFNSRMQVLSNNINDVAITVGNKLLPVFNPLLQDINDLLSGGKGLNEQFDAETANTISDIGTAFQDLSGPVKENADEVLDLATKLWDLSHNVLPSVAPALRDIRFILEGTASALDTINESLETATELWNKLPPGLRRGVTRSAVEVATAPIGGPGTIQGLRAARRGSERGVRPPSLPDEVTVGSRGGRRQDEITLRVEGDGVLSGLIRDNVSVEFQQRENRAIRTGSR